MPPRTGKPGRPRKAFKRWPRGAVYATVSKTYTKGRVKEVKRKLVHGDEADLARALASSSSSKKINTAFVERQNGTDRSYNARKARKTLEFSKSFVVHVAVTWWVMLCYNFHHVHRGLRLVAADGTYQKRTPAMAAELADAPWSVAEILSLQIVGFAPVGPVTPQHFGIRRSAGPAP